MPGGVRSHGPTGSSPRAIGKLQTWAGTDRCQQCRDDVSCGLGDRVCQPRRGVHPIEDEPIFKATPTPQVDDDVLQNPQSMAPLNAEQLGGQRVWVVGPEGASSTSSDLVSVATLSPTTQAGSANQGRVRADMKVIANIFNSQGTPVNPNAPGIWWTGTHGTPEGDFGNVEGRFLKQESGYGRYYGWAPLNARGPGADFFSDTNKPTVMMWCFSSAWCITNAQ